MMAGHRPESQVLYTCEPSQRHPFSSNLLIFKAEIPVILQGVMGCHHITLSCGQSVLPFFERVTMVFHFFSDSALFPVGMASSAGMTPALDPRPKCLCQPASASTYPSQ